MYGTNGLTAEHTEAVSQLKGLTEIILFLDGDQAGRKAAEKYGPVLKKLQPKAKIRIVETPEGEDVNSLLDGHDTEILQSLLNPSIAGRSSSEDLNRKTIAVSSPDEGLNTDNPQNITYKTQTANYQVKGFSTNQPMDSLKTTLQIISANLTFRGKCDLYEYKQVDLWPNKLHKNYNWAKKTSK